MVNERICNKCLEVLPLSEFSLNSKGKYGVKSICKGCSNLAERSRRAKEWAEDSKRVSFNRHIKKLKYIYGITPEEYEGLYKYQEGKCGICGIEGEAYFKCHPTQNYFHVDHCHHTNKVRGLLCTNCNSGLGKLQDSEEVLQKALGYLQKPPYQTLKKEKDES